MKSPDAITKSTRGMLTHDEIMTMSRDELYRYGKSNRDLLIKRAKRLEEKIAANPGMYAPHGLAKLKGDSEYKGADRNGIPMISKDMNLHTLRANVGYSEHLKSLKTSTLSGAKKVQEQQIRMSLGLPKEGKLNAEEKRRYKEGTQFVQDNPDAMRIHWEAFQHFQTENQHRNLDSGRLLDEFNIVYNDAKQSGYQDMEDLTGYVSDYVRVKHEEEEKRQDMSGRFKQASKWGLDD